MKIGIDIRVVAAEHKSGIGRYTYNLVKKLIDIDEKNEYLLFCDREAQRFFPTKENVHIVVIKVPLEFLWEQLAVPLFLIKNKVDIFFRPNDIGGSFLYNSKLIVTVHDIIPLHFPQLYFRNFLHKAYYHLKLCLVNKIARYIITVSNYSKKDLLAVLRVPDDRIVVIPEVVDEIFQVKDRSSLLSKIKYKYDFESPFILCMGGAEPRKNLANLIKAFHVLKMKKEIEHKLLIVGRQWRNKSLVPLIKELFLEDEIICVGYVSDQDFVALYNSADLFVFPSLCEGFGLPVLEAMACGTPVITSNCSSLPEVAGDAAILVNPEDEEEIADAIMRVITNDSLRESLRKKGLERVRLFTWEDTARKTLKIFEEVVICGRKVRDKYDTKN